MKCRKRIDGIGTGVESLPREEPGGSLLTGQAGVRHGCWRERDPGSRVERGNLSPRGRSASGALWPAVGGLSESPKQLICEGESSDAGHRGGPSRSSGEGSVMGLERRGRVVLAGLSVNRVGGRSRVSEPKLKQSFDISKWAVWEAYRRVKANKGGAGC